ncbi:hypothetical protein RDWZM_010417 [Blomia tropicalis]|uniref:Tubby C-terminal domain-containing protein n=1 Tax=Blomia tropicalis TaxID=40697 RepID=A0A9Q0LZ57_BLOTA|nr:hypothetical protein RDWZM_010417 [Blomia tropicalis]
MFVRFEPIRRPNSYSDSPITCLSWMNNDPETGNNNNEIEQSNTNTINDGTIRDNGDNDTLEPTINDDIDLNNNQLSHNQHNIRSIPRPNSVQHNHDDGSSMNNRRTKQRQRSKHIHLKDNNNKFDDDDELIAKDGWLATGTSRGVVGVSYTTTKPNQYFVSTGLIPPNPGQSRLEHSSHLVREAQQQQQQPIDGQSNDGNIVHCPRTRLPLRTNYNLRGHRSELMFVRWNEPYQKLATCDENGVIFIWIKYEGRWSIELINDRNTRVTDIAWSHDGPVSFIDGTVFIMKSYDDLDPKLIRTDLIGLKMDWTNDGRVLAIGGHRLVRADSPMDRFIYSNVINFYSVKAFSTDRYLMTILVRPIRSIVLQCDHHQLTAMTWGNQDQRIYVACGQTLLIGWIFHNIPSLTFLCCNQINKCLRDNDETKLDSLHLPEPIKTSIRDLFTSTVCCYLPDYRRIREFVFRPPANGTRLYCTLVRHDDDHNNSGGNQTTTTPSTTSSATSTTTTTNSTFTSIDNIDTISSSTYILYLEYLGGLVPILKGKRSSKLKPEFIIFDPQHNSNVRPDQLKPKILSTYNTVNNSSESEYDEAPSFIFSYLTPRARRRYRRARSQQDSPVRRRSHNGNHNNIDANMRHNNTTMFNIGTNVAVVSDRSSQMLPIGEELPEQRKIVLIASNIWGTKFKFLGLSSMLPSRLGTMNYRTSFLHLQPRQMGLMIKELNRQNTCTETVTSSSSSSISSSSSSMKNNENIRRSDRHLTNGIRVNQSLSCGETSDSDSDMSITAIDSYFMNHHQPGRRDELGTPAVVPISSPRLLRNSLLLSSATVPEHLNVQPIQSSVRSSEQFMPLELNESSNEHQSIEPNDELQSEIEQMVIPARYINDEFLTLHIGDSGGRPTYSMEITCSPQLNQRITPRVTSTTAATTSATTTTTTTTEYYPVQVSSDEPTVATTTTTTTATSHTNTFVRQFKHQTFQSESPKHVSYFYWQTPISSLAKLGSPNISPSKNIRQILKESPRKSSVSFCSSEFSTPTKSYVEKHGTNGGTLAHHPPSSLKIGGGDSGGIHCNQDDSIYQSRIRCVNRSKSNLIHRSPSHSNVGTCVDTFGGQTATQRRMQFRNIDNHGRSSKSFESSSLIVQCSNDDSQTQSSSHHLDEVEQVVKLLSDKLQLQQSSIVNMGSNPIHLEPRCEIISAAAAVQSNRRNSLPFQRNNTNEPDLRQRTITLNHNHHHHHQQQRHEMRSLPSSPLPNSITNRIAENIESSQQQTTTALMTNRRKSNGRHFFNSPNVIRRMRRKLSYLDCSSEDETSDDDDDVLNERCKRNVINGRWKQKQDELQQQRQLGTTINNTTPKKKNKTKKNKSINDNNIEELAGKMFELRNKAPLWNEVTQVYQLDFGGRVTQESAKNFQIESNEQQVMQFGRIDRNAYTLDFEYPFSAIQALSVALANVTQRFK